MSSNQVRKTHPMVLVAAASLTVFSILGSAAITGLIPSVHSEKSDQIIDQKSKTENGGKLIESSQSTQKNMATGKISDSLQQSSLKNVACRDCGEIVSIKQIKVEGDATGLGAVAGGVTGGVIGNQIGKGKGNVLMTVLGVGGGAYAGHRIEKNINSETAYVVKVRMADGEYRTLTQHQRPKYSIGDQVKLKSNHLMDA